MLEWVIIRGVQIIVLPQLLKAPSSITILKENKKVMRTARRITTQSYVEDEN